MPKADRVRSTQRTRAPVNSRRAYPDAELLALGDDLGKAITTEDKAFADAEVVRDRSGSTKKELLSSSKAADQAMKATKVLVLRIVALPAVTVAGMRVKARAVRWCWGGEVYRFDEVGDQLATDQRLIRSLLADLDAETDAML